VRRTVTGIAGIAPVSDTATEPAIGGISVSVPRRDTDTSTHHRHAQGTQALAAGPRQSHVFTADQEALIDATVAALLLDLQQFADVTADSRSGLDRRDRLAAEGVEKPAVTR